MLQELFNMLTILMAFNKAGQALGSLLSGIAWGQLGTTESASPG